MEKLLNCDLIVDIERIDSISGANEAYEIFFTAKNRKKFKLAFDFVWDIRCAIENAYIDRFSKFDKSAVKASSVVLIQDSEYIKYFAEQSSGTRPINDLKDYLIFDAVNTVIEVLSAEGPALIELQ